MIRAVIKNNKQEISANITSNNEKITANVENYASQPRGCVNERLDVYPERLIVGDQERLNTSLYADNNGVSIRINMQQLKEMNTKIVATDDINSVDMSNLTKGDYIYLNNEKN